MREQILSLELMTGVPSFGEIALITFSSDLTLIIIKEKAWKTVRLTMTVILRKVMHFSSCIIPGDIGKVRNVIQSINTPTKLRENFSLK